MRRLFQVFDKVSQLAVGPVIPFGADAAAVRMFYDLLGNKATDPGQHPRDYILLGVGDQDEGTGSISSCTPMVVATGIAWEEGQNRNAAELSLLRSEA